MVTLPGFGVPKVKLLLRGAATAVVGVLAVCLVNVASAPVGATVPDGAPSNGDWLRAAALGSLASVGDARRTVVVSDEVAPAAAPYVLAPGWFPGQPDDLHALSAMDGAPTRAAPTLRARSAFVYDLDAGEVLVDRNADVVRPVASLTKVVSALTLASTRASLDNGFCVSAAQYPTRSGATSRLSTGDCLTGWDTLGAALVASDNRGAYGMAAVADMDVDTFVEAMNGVSADLGMDRSSWSDPSGLEDENLSTARDMARATIALASHPVLAPVASAPFWDLHRANRSGARRLFSTTRIIDRPDLEVLAAKTGYTDTARYCFTTALQTAGGRRLVITLLGAEGKMTRWADVERILDWADEPA
jgi:D-alanyl-D-alanine endopeptidase (penicillin-binding protein 7)